MRLFTGKIMLILLLSVFEFMLVRFKVEFGSVLVYRYTRADTKDQTIHYSLSMNPKQRKYNGYSLVCRYTRTEPCDW